jgi:hypothetical protein
MPPRFATTLCLALLACSPQAPLGQLCDPVDASFCTVWMLACVLDAGSGRCETPGEFQPCAPALGCSGSRFQCVGPFPGPPPNYFCFQACTATPDCVDPDTACLASTDPTGSFCAPNDCGPGSGVDGGSSNGTAFFAPCDVLDAGDGTCIPYTYADAGTFGTCQAAGPAPDGGACDIDRQGSAPLCQVGFGCNQTSSSTPGSCAPLCDSLDAGGPICASGTSCQPEPGFSAGVCQG